MPGKPLKIPLELPEMDFDSAVSDGRDELNLAEFPLSVLSARHTDQDTKVLVFEDRVWDSGNSAMVFRKVTVSSSADCGLPTPTDEDVLLALIQLTRQQGFRSRRVQFSRAQIIQLLGWDVNGQTYARLLKSLSKWLGVNIRWTQAWRDYAQQSAWKDHGVVLIQDFHIERGADSCHVTWSDHMFASFTAGNLKTLDFRLYRTLPTPISKRMYRFLDKRFYGRASLKFDLATFAYEKIGIKRTCGLNNVKQQLRSAIEELVAVGFLKGASDQDRYHKRRAGEWDVLFEAAADRQKGKAPLPAEDVEVEVVPSTEQELVRRGVSRGRAKRLAGRYPEEHIRGQLEAFDFLMSAKGNETQRPKNPGGYLAESIREKYAPPAGYESAEQRRKREKAAAARAGKVAAKASREERTVVAARQGADATAARVQAFLDRLSPAAREAIEAEALAASPLGAGAIQRPYMREAIIRNHVETLLGAAP
ncbi:MAG: Replication initiator protein [Verrucomicrobiales bacterium]|nr:Replication initiator protein [Verrucomicrobiales bacterium]